MAQNLDPNFNGPNDQLGKRNLNDIPASDDGIGENTEQTPVAKAQNEAQTGPSGNGGEERIPTVTPYNENGLPGPDDDDEDDDTLLDDDDDDYEEIIPIEGDDDEPDDNFDDDDDEDDDDDIVDRAGSRSVTVVAE